MRNKLVWVSLLLCVVTPVTAQVGIAIRSANVSIGINLPLYPQLVRVPDYPVYYAPDLDSNYFFYDGLYWVYQDDNWYESAWYNGPWDLIDPYYVPVYVLRIPVRYYRLQPTYFRYWQADAAPHWDEHWGNNWSQRRSGWDQWNHNSAPAPAPLPIYQRQYTGDRYPKPAQQQALQTKNYRYQPRTPIPQQQQVPPAQSAPALARPATSGFQQNKNSEPRTHERLQSTASAPTNAPAAPGNSAAKPSRENAQKSTPVPTTPAANDASHQQQRQQLQPQAAQRQQPAERSSAQKKKPVNNPTAQEPRRAKNAEQDKDRDKADERDQNRNR
jgi:hypothetical protein